MEEPKLPTLIECRDELALWARYARRQIQSIDDEIGRIERHIRDMESRLSRRTNVQQLASTGVGFIGVIVAVTTVVGGVIIAGGAGLLSADASIRGLNWRKTKQELEAEIDRLKARRRQWDDESQAVEEARRNVERQIGEGKEHPKLLEKPAQRVLPPPKKPGRKKRKPR